MLHYTPKFYDSYDMFVLLFFLLIHNTSVMCITVLLPGTLTPTVSGSLVAGGP